MVFVSGLIKPRGKTTTHCLTVALLEVVEITLSREEVHLLNNTDRAAANLVQVHSQLGFVRTVLFVHHFLCASSHSLSDASLAPYNNITKNLQKRQICS